MESIYTELALYGSTIECARTDNVFTPISEVCYGTVSLRIFSRGLENNHTFNCCSTISNLTVYIKDVGQFLDLHFTVSLFSNPEDKVLKSRRKKLWDKSVPYFWQESGPSPPDWRTTIHWIFGPAIFQPPRPMVKFKTFDTTFHRMVVLQSKGKDSKYCSHFMKPGSQSVI